MMHLVILVHGTWGRGVSAWYHTTSASTNFSSRLRVALGKRGIDPESVIFLPFEWEGGNTHAVRLEGASLLATKLIKLRSQYADAKIHFVAHSHGGNVVLKALEIYLNDLAWTDVPNLTDTRDIVVASKRFLDDYAGGKYQFRSPTDKVDKVLRQLADSLEKIEQRKNERFRVSIADGSIHDLEWSSLRQLLGKAYSQVYALPEHHRIGCVITLGTPFYEKHWKLSPVAGMTNWLLNAVFYLPAISLVTYILIVLGSALAAATPWISWVGINPVHWHWLVLVNWGIFTTWLTFSISKTFKPGLPLDTNVYFDEAVLPYYLRIVEKVKICRVLNIHATYLDEVYCLLSAYPFLSGTITNHIAKASLPRLWDFKKPSGYVGFWRGSPPAMVRQFIKWHIRFTTALLKAIAYPIRLFVHRLKTKYLSHVIGADFRVFGYGLPLDESHGSCVIAVENELHKPFFVTHTLDVSQQLAKLILNGVDGKDRYDFLWNDDDLARRVNDSELLRNLAEPHISDYYRQLIVLEERAREFFGVVGLKHTMYYDNDVVIKGIADFITDQAPSVQCEGSLEDG